MAAAPSSGSTTIVVAEAPATSAVLKGMQSDEAGTKPNQSISLGFDFKESNLLGMCVAGARECLGTAFFLFFNISTIMFNDEGLSAAGKVMIAFQFGICIFVLVYIFADKTGANINPAVSWGLMISKRISLPRGILYIIMQCVGATIGTAIARSTNETLFSAAQGGTNRVFPGISNGSAFVAEIIATGFLVLTVLHATSQGYVGKHMGPQLPLAIGMAVFVAHLALIPIDGCSINPARSLGPAIITGDYSQMGIFWGGPLVGATLVTLWYEFFGSMDRKSARREDGDVTGATGVTTEIATGMHDKKEIEV